VVFSYGIATGQGLLADVAMSRLERDLPLPTPAPCAAT